MGKKQNRVKAMECGGQIAQVNGMARDGLLEKGEICIMNSLRKGDFQVTVWEQGG